MQVHPGRQRVFVDDDVVAFGTHARRNGGNLREEAVPREVFRHRGHDDPVTVLAPFQDDAVLRAGHDAELEVALEAFSVLADRLPVDLPDRV